MTAPSPAASPKAAPEHGLQRQMRLSDLVLAQVLCVVGSTWVGVAAVLGQAQALTWIAAMLLFYFPMAAVVVLLNRIMPLEGGLYVWAHRAFGDLGGFLTASSVGVHAQEAYQVLSNASLTHYEVTYMAMFAIPLAGAASLRRSLPSWLKYVSLAGLCASLFSLLISIYPFINVVNPLEYGVKIAGTVLASNAVAVTFYTLRKRKLFLDEVSRAKGSGHV